jgi:hypothetical protein
MFNNRNDEIGFLKEELKKLDESGRVPVPQKAEIYNSSPGIGVKGIIFFILVMFFLYVGYDYLSSGKTYETIFFLFLALLLILSVKDEIAKFFDKSVQLEISDDCIIFDSERFEWGNINGDVIHYGAEIRKRWPLVLTFSSKNTNYTIDISDLDISEHEFKYLYYSYKLGYLEKL